MDLTQFPYFANPYDEYYNKKYRKLIGIPGRVLQAREITNLSYFPFYAIKDIGDIFYYNSQILDGISANEVDKVDYLFSSICDIDESEVVEF